MSRLTSLIADLCPDGVKFRRLDEVGAIYGGLTGKSKSDFTGGNAKFVTYVNAFKNLSTNVSPEDSVRVGPSERQNRVRYGDVLFTASSENAEEVGMSSGVTVEPPEPLYLNSFCFGFRPNDAAELDPGFTKHLFRSAAMLRQIIRTANGVTRINVSKERFRKIIVPVPPRQIQVEIGRILDEFKALETELATELEAELEARRRQYEHYRDSLLATPGVPFHPMGEVGVFFRGRRFTKKDVVEEGIESIHYGEIYTSYGTSAERSISHVDPELRSTLRFAEPGDVVITAVGETVEDVGKAVAWLGSGEVAIHDDCFAFRHALNPKFVSYCLQTKALNDEKAKYVARAKVKRISGESLAKLTIPLPALDEQNRIVGILDKFNAFVNDLKSGLPAEISARRQQYEHYRDQLLTFKEKTR